MRMISISRPLAGKIPQSRAAKSGSAVIVNAALEILVFPWRSWASPDKGRDTRSAMSAAVCARENQVGRNRFFIICSLKIISHRLLQSSGLYVKNIAGPCLYDKSSSTAIPMSRSETSRGKPAAYLDSRPVSTYLNSMSFLAPGLNCGLGFPQTRHRDNYDFEPCRPLFTENYQREED